MTKAAHQELVGEKSALALLGRQGFLEADLLHWVKGGWVTGDYLWPLEPPPKGVFEKRSTAPDPHVRVFARFADRDVIVATHMKLRGNFRGRRSRTWNSQMTDCCTEWRRLFGSVDPIKGSSIYDYVSGECDDIPLPRGW